MCFQPILHNIIYSQCIQKLSRTSVSFRESCNNKFHCLYDIQSVFILVCNLLLGIQSKELFCHLGKEIYICKFSDTTEDISCTAATVSLASISQLYSDISLLCHKSNVALHSIVELFLLLPKIVPYTTAIGNKTSMSWHSSSTHAPSSINSLGQFWPVSTNSLLDYAWVQFWTLHGPFRHIVSLAFRPREQDGSQRINVDTVP